MFQPPMLRSGFCAKRKSVYPIEVFWKTGMLTLPVSCYELGSGWIDRGKPTLGPNIDWMGGAVL